MGYIDRDVLEDLDDALDDEIEDFADSINGILYEYNLHEKEPFIGHIVQTRLNELQEFIFEFLKQYVKD